MLEHLPATGDVRIAVVGDAMLDLYTWGDVSRISPEAPVPVVSYTRESATPGGAANAAACVAALGARVDLVAKVGDDANGAKLAALLSGVGVQLLTLSGTDEPTTTKNRIWSGGQQLLRLDIERASGDGAGSDDLAGVLDLGDIDAVLISDYGKGVVNPESAAWLVSEGRRTGTPVVVDPKFGDFRQFRGCTTIKPNEREATSAFEARFGRTGTLEEMGRYLIDEVAESAIVSLGPHGLTLFADGASRHFEPRARGVYDVTGAGDVVAAVVTVGAASGWSFAETCEVANMAAGVCVSRVGTGGVTMEEVERYRIDLLLQAGDATPDPAVQPTAQ